LELVGDYYNGGPPRGGPDYGVVFGPSAVAAATVSELIEVVAPFPSPNNTLSFVFPPTSTGYSTYMTVEAGFTGLSFQYLLHGDDGGSSTPLYVYDGPNKTGTVLGTYYLFETNDAWVGYSFQLSETAKSLEFILQSAFPLLFDDMDISLVSLSQVPTSAPSQAPTAAPLPPTCEGTTYWVYNAATNAPLRRLFNNSVACLAHPYSVEVRPCIIGATAALSMKLVRTFPDRRRTVVYRQVDANAPYYLFGDAAGDVFPSPTPLPNGNYQLIWSNDSSSGGGGGGGSVVFAQSCPCPKGMKGCRMMKRTLGK
jgi:hypothetical protein